MGAVLAEREEEGLSAAIEAAVIETTTCLDQNIEPKSSLGWALWTLLPDQGSQLFGHYA